MKKPRRGVRRGFRLRVGERSKDGVRNRDDGGRWLHGYATNKPVNTSLHLAVHCFHVNLSGFEFFDVAECTKRLINVKDYYNRTQVFGHGFSC